LRSGDAVDLLLYKLVQEFCKSAVQYFRLTNQQRAPVPPPPVPEELYSFKPSITKYVTKRDGRDRPTTSASSDIDGDGFDESHEGIRHSRSGSVGSGSRAGDIHDRLFKEAKKLQKKREIIREELAFEADAEFSFQPKINKGATPSARYHRASSVGGWGMSQSQGSTPRGASMSGGYDSEGDGQSIMRSDFFQQL
jgi:hypothetical protein